ncbi:MAG: transporter permease [Clostridiales bacterium]|jgi:hypothetical integral membrane protein (TIGR02206 family)|nr:transporter permease [Clostridiales bacterium]
METFLSKDIIMPPFAIFSREHIVTLIALATINILLVICFLKFGETKSVNNFRKGLAVFLIFNELYYITWSILTGDWSMEYSLPLQLCEAVMFASAAMLILDNYNIFEVVYFLGLGGGIQALLTPDLYYPFPHSRFFSFFLGHNAVFLAIFYMMAVRKFKPSFKSIIKTFVITNIYMIFISIVNVLTGGNYLFLRSKPVNGSILDFLGPWPWYIFSLEGIGLIIFLVLYLPFRIAANNNIQSYIAPHNVHSVK